MSLSHDPSIILNFVKIIERYPDLYDNNCEAYKKYGSDRSWAKVVECLKNEHNVDSTVDELKLKWKGIRSSYSRYRGKLYHSKHTGQQLTKYYLSDALNYLEPFTKPKSIPRNINTGAAFEECDNHDYEDDIDDNSNDCDTNLCEWSNVEIKPEIRNNEIMEQSSEAEYIPEKSRKRKYDSKEENSDMQFFRSILPDIETFSSKEKRILKIGILELINKIENDRQSIKIELI